MSISTGDRLPSVKLATMGANGIERVDAAELFAGKKAVLFAVPGAFTPTCSQQHLPGYITQAPGLQGQGR